MGKRFGFCRTEPNLSVRFGSVLWAKTKWFKKYWTDWFEFGSVQNRTEPKNQSVRLLQNNKFKIKFQSQKFKSLNHDCILLPLPLSLAPRPRVSLSSRRSSSTAAPPLGSIFPLCACMVQFGSAPLGLFLASLPRLTPRSAPSTALQ